MKQSKLMSSLESAINIVVGLGVAMLANAIILPMVGIDVSLKQNSIIAAFMTVVSFGRSFALRRMFEALHIRNPISPFMQAVIAERRRQIEVEGWTAEHDDGQERGELALAGAAYLFGPEKRLLTDYDDVDEPAISVSGRLLWPWEIDYWKPQEFRRNIIRGCALGIAEGEKCDRQKGARHRRRKITDDDLPTRERELSAK